MSKIALIQELEEAFKKSDIRSKKELAEKSGVSYATVLNILNKGSGRDESIRALCEVLGINADRTPHGEFVDALNKAKEVGAVYEILEGPYTARIGIRDSKGKFMTRATVSVSAKDWKKKAQAVAAKFNKETQLGM